VRQSGDRLVDLSIAFSVALAPILIASAARLLDTNAAGQTTFDRCRQCRTEIIPLTRCGFAPRG
jgi:hypothetical protein